ncbi:hypothetical protein HYU19_05235 [Candidatus Woesearchaeota archaeon]|nr:hypothetical protein [Candidatus Woesearchaeota archaeon]
MPHILMGKEAFNQQAENTNEFSAEIQSIGDPVEAIRGMLKHVKKTSVEIQHETSTIRSERH